MHFGVAPSGVGCDDYNVVELACRGKAVANLYGASLGNPVLIVAPHTVQEVNHWEAGFGVCEISLWHNGGVGPRSIENCAVNCVGDSLVATRRVGGERAEHYRKG